MDEIVNMIMGYSTELDAEVIIRLIVMMMGLELFTAACGLIAQMKGR